MTHHRAIGALLATAALLSACSKGENGDHPQGADEFAAVSATADTRRPLAATPAAGGVAAVTATDAKAVTTATEYKLTDENFSKYMAATDSLTALRHRNPAVDSLLNMQVSDGVNGTTVSASNAGRKRLENHPAIASAITSAGMSVRDYFVASIAIAQAARFMGDPKAAPPTPTLGPNAAFLNAHKAQLARIRSTN